MICALLVTLTQMTGSAVAAVTRVGSWTTGLSHTPGAGVERLLVFAVGYEDSVDAGISAVTFGGQAMTRLAGAAAGTSLFDRSELWYLKEAGIVAAAGNSFTVTWGGAPPANVAYGAATYAGVDQLNPVADRDSAFTNAATPNPLTRRVTSKTNSYVVANYICGNGGSYTWGNGFAEGFDQTSGSTLTMSAGDLQRVQPGSVQASATHTGPDRQAVVAAVLQEVFPNQPPVLAAIGAQAVAEGDTLNFGVSATDPDGTTPALTTSALPANANFTDNGDGTGTFGFAPDFAQAGSYDITFYASDGIATDSELVTITVTDVNQEPVLAAIGAQAVAEGDTLNFGVSATDADGTTPALTTSALPANANFTDNGDGTGTFGFAPDFAQAGSYDVTFYATDGIATDSELVTITVTDVNQAPVLAAIGAQAVLEGDTLNFGVSATDADGTTPALTTSTLPANANFTDNGDGTGTFDFAPDFAQAGSYDVTFYATDGNDTDSEAVTITVSNVNQPPVLAAIGPQSVAEGDTLSFGVSVSDPDGTTPALIASALPANAGFTDNGDGTGTFDFAPDFAQAGSYDVTFYTSDGSATDSEVVTITVTDVNQAPVLAAIGAQTVAEGDTLSFAVSATDADGTTPALTTSVLPANANFTDHGDGTGAFDFAPDFTQAGSYDVTFYATDGSDTDSELVTITVTENSPVTISGHAGMAGVVLSYDTDSTETVTTDSSGFYSFSVPYSWSGTVTPTMPGYGFTPASRDYAAVTANQIDQDYAASITVGVGDENTVLPDHFGLDQNYPNPFNPETAIGYSLEQAGHVTVEVFNIIGHRVTVLVQGQMAAGTYVTRWNGTDFGGRPVASGVYFYRIQAGDFTQTRKMLLLR